jgi:hypothetical protein
MSWHVHVSVFHTLVVWSSEPMMGLLPCINKLYTSSPWPSRVRSHVRVSVFQILIFDREVIRAADQLLIAVHHQTTHMQCQYDL